MAQILKLVDAILINKIYKNLNQLDCFQPCRHKFKSARLAAGFNPIAAFSIENVTLQAVSKTARSGSSLVDSIGPGN